MLTVDTGRGSMMFRHESGPPDCRTSLRAAAFGFPSDATTTRNDHMATDHIRYDVLARDALRGVLRHVLTDVAQHGLPGEHHFFITFQSKADGVKLSPRLLAQYPEEMTVVLQHQFWDLVVTEDRFEVGLSFGGIPERLVVPFAAIKSFFDPSVKFGLQFEAADEAEDTDESENAGEVATAASAPVSLPPSAAATDDPPSDDEPPRSGEGAEVVRLDRFRKK
ncbi:ClpXP protease specificity-enhancing factor SspB [Rubrivivax sp. JA1024]|nr:ClpXP protease specificity-enhancing factor SspB [Rubrivivax sp. JA1024]